MTLLSRKETRITLLLSLVLLVLVGCDNMVEQAKIDQPYGESEVFETAARDLEPNTVPVGFLREDEALYMGTQDGSPVEELPIELTVEVFTNGQLLYENFCTPCHGFSGYGNGIVAEEGFPQPASFHDGATAALSVGEMFDVITNGQGAMFSYATRIQPEDRWAIIAYIRALQLSQNASYGDLTPDMQAALDELAE